MCAYIYTRSIEKRNGSSSAGWKRSGNETTLIIKPSHNMLLMNSSPFPSIVHVRGAPASTPLYPYSTHELATWTRELFLLAPFSLPARYRRIGTTWLYIDVAADDRAKAIIIAVRESRLQGSWFARTERESSPGTDSTRPRREFSFARPSIRSFVRSFATHRCIAASRMPDREALYLTVNPPTCSRIGGKTT